MDMSSVGCLVNSICRFIHLVSCQTSKPTPILKDYQTMVTVLKHLKPVLDEVVDRTISPDDVLIKQCEELDTTVNEAREYMEKLCPKMSKICSVYKSEFFLKKIHSSSVEICHVLCRLYKASPSTSGLTGVQLCLQKIQCLKMESITNKVEEALRSQKAQVVPCNDYLVKISELLSLTSGQEFFQENLAVEKERLNIEANKSKGVLKEINQIVELISHLRDYLLNVESFEAKSGVLIPPYFRCPLSLELMLDPVIVASGQTYDRSSIQKWLDHGLTICPKTGQKLTHTNIISNYTVKAMISNWCEENKIKLPGNSDHGNIVSVPSPPASNSQRSDGSRCALYDTNTTSRSNPGVDNGFEKKMADNSSRLCGEEQNVCRLRETEDFECPSHELSYIHSRSESTSSAISSIEYVPQSSLESRTLTKHEKARDLSGEITSECRVASPSNRESGVSPWFLNNQPYSPNTKADLASNGHHNHIKVQSPENSGFDELTTALHVKKMVEDLKSSSNEVQTAAAEELRLLGKHNMENRIIIGQCGAINPLISLLYSEVKLTQEHAVTALLNLSINDKNKNMIAEAGAIDPLIHALKFGNTGAKENSAATLFSLSVLEEYKAKIGRSGAIKALVDLLASGTVRGKKDAATALFNLSIFHENKARIVQAGAIKHLVELLNPDTGMIDKAVALLANLSTITEGRSAIVRAGAVPLLVEVVETGSPRGKENAASVLVQLCINNPKYCTLVLQEGAVPPLVSLSQSGTPRAKEKAQQLLSHFRCQRELSGGKGK